MDLQQAKPTDLPASVQGWGEEIGLPAAIKLSEHYGGQERLYVPATMTEFHPIAQAIGLEAAIKLSRIWGGDYLLQIPRCTAALRRIRDARICKANNEGVPAVELARKYALTERRIREILREGRQPRAVQYSLFG